MAVELIGIVTYELNEPPQQCIGQFYLTKELLQKLEQLRVESEEFIDRSVHMELLFARGNSEWSI